VQCWDLLARPDFLDPGTPTHKEHVQAPTTWFLQGLQGLQGPVYLQHPLSLTLPADVWECIVPTHPKGCKPISPYKLLDKPTETCVCSQPETAAVTHIHCNVLHGVFTFSVSLA
jgi:hypothetical protein